MDFDEYTIVYRGSPGSGITVAEDGDQRNIYQDDGVLQSSMLFSDPNGLCLEYSQAMMCALLFQPTPARVLLVGLGGGSLAKFLLEFCPDASIDVAEIQSEVIRVAHEYFFLPRSDKLQIIHAPGEDVVARKKESGAQYDMILIDAFDDNGPARALLERDFLFNCKALLARKGVFAMNLWNRPGDDFPAIYARFAKIYSHQVYELMLDGANQNGIVFCFKEGPEHDNLMELKPVAQGLSRGSGINFVRWLRQLHWQNMKKKRFS